MFQGALNRRIAHASFMLAAAWLAGAAGNAAAETTTTHVALTGAATRPYGERPVVRGWIAVSDLPCSGPPPEQPGGGVSIRLNGVHSYTTPLASPSTCVDGHVEMAFHIDNDLMPIGTQVVSAEYSGDGRFRGSISAPVTVTVAPQFSGSASPTSGVVQVGITGDTNGGDYWDCRISTAAMTETGGVPSTPPVRLEFPYGYFNYQFDTCSRRGDPATMPPPGPLRQRLLLRAPAPLPAGASLWTYGPKQSGAFPEWYELRARVDGPYLDVIVEDGAAGDHTVLGDGFIRGFVAIAVPRVNRLKFDVAGLWWAGPQENGWGMSIARERDTLFNTFFVYDESGRGQWIVMPGGTWNPEYTVYTGDLHIPTGAWFGNYDLSVLRVGDAVGSATLTFTADDAATLGYTVRGTSGTKILRKQVFGGPPAIPEKLAGLWWGGPTQNGWGLSIHQQGGTLFNVWYTYDPSGNAVWYVMPGGSWVLPRVYSGPLYRTRGSPWAGRVYDPARLTVERTGTMTIAFDSESNAYLTYVLDGVEATRSITRQPF